MPFLLRCTRHPWQRRQMSKFWGSMPWFRSQAPDSSSPSAASPRPWSQANHSAFSAGSSRGPRTFPPGSSWLRLDKSRWTGLAASCPRALDRRLAVRAQPMAEPKMRRSMEMCCCSSALPTSTFSLTGKRTKRRGRRACGNWASTRALQTAPCPAQSVKIRLRVGQDPSSSAVSMRINTGMSSLWSILARKSARAANACRSAAAGALASSGTARPVWRTTLR
mmetsp:Transcript_52313/g.94136  ORF Transcript_52313/g.94136 Transcript_52313/m.94136 type:complete len:222 (-) Transcript_52313:1331-1996(-)